MQAVIMAGGKGTRIASVASDIPKPMIEICGKPILQHQIECLREQGITDIILVIGHIGYVIKGYFQDGRVISESTRVSAPGLRVLSGFYGTGLYDVYFIHQRSAFDDAEEADGTASGSGGTSEDEKAEDEESLRRYAAQSGDRPGDAERSEDPDPGRTNCGA